MPAYKELDRTDRAILSELQQDGSLSVAQLSEKVGLSTTPCWKRVKSMEESGLIEKRVAIVNREQAGLPVTVFVSLRTNRHDEAWLRKFAASVSSMPEVMEFHRMSGDVDYLLKVVAADIAGYDRFFAEPLSNAHLAAIATYNDFIPAFRALMAREKTFPRFYAAARELAALVAAGEDLRELDAPEVIAAADRVIERLTRESPIPAATRRATAIPVMRVPVRV